MFNRLRQPLSRVEGEVTTLTTASHITTTPQTVRFRKSPRTSQSAKDKSKAGR